MTKQKSNKNGVLEANGNGAGDSRLSAVRDLIFGDNIQQYQKEFDTVRKEIDALKGVSEKSLSETSDHLEARIDELEASLNKSMDKLWNDLNKRITKLEDTSTDRRKLGKALEKIAVSLQE